MVWYMCVHIYQSRQRNTLGGIIFMHKLVCRFITIAPHKSTTILKGHITTNFTSSRMP